MKQVLKFTEKHNLKIVSVTYKNIKRKGFDITTKDNFILLSFKPTSYHKISVYNTDKWCVIDLVNNNLQYRKSFSDWEKNNKDWQSVKQTSYILK